MTTELIENISGSSGSDSTDGSSGNSNNSMKQWIIDNKWLIGSIIVLITASLIVYLVSDDSSGGGTASTGAGAGAGAGNDVNTGGQPQMPQFAPPIDVPPSTVAVRPARNIPRSNTPSTAPSPPAEEVPSLSPSPPVEEVQPPPSCSVTYVNENMNIVDSTCIINQYSSASTTTGTEGITSTVDIPHGESCNFTCSGATVLGNSEGSNYDFSRSSNPNFTCNGQNYSFICEDSPPPPPSAGLPSCESVKTSGRQPHSGQSSSHLNYSLNNCVDACQRDPSCISFTYNPTRLSCNIYSQVEGEVSGQGIDYYDSKCQLP